jgi:uncharacterized repeat protein (TIGR03803 family)
VLRKFICFSFLPISALVLSPLRAQAQTYTQSVIYTACDTASCADYPYSLVQAQDGDFYGENQTGAYQSGAIFKLTPGGSLSPLYSFCAQQDGYGICSDGSFPSSLVQSGSGNFYGISSSQFIEENSYNLFQGGVAFDITPSGGFTSFVVFCSQQFSNCTDGFAAGYDPAPLALGAQGTLYGVLANGGGANDGGTIITFGSLTPLYIFCSQGGSGCTDGSQPNSILQGSDGNLYGTTSPGAYSQGNPVDGTIFKFAAGTLTVLQSFCYQSITPCPGGSGPNGIVEGSDGNFYGTTSTNGTTTNPAGGTVFKITPSGAFTTLHTFCPQGGPVCTDGDGPLDLVLAGDGNFYGITTGGGTHASGTLFRITPTGTFSTIYNFCSQGGSGCTDGIGPNSLTLGNDGSLYGTTIYGGAVGEGGGPGFGVVFKVAATPALPAPVQISLSRLQITLGSFATLTWRSLNAFSTTMQQCYAFETNQGTTTPLGALSGTMSNGIYSGSIIVTPPALGSYTFAVSCGGVESSAPMTLNVIPVGKYSSTTSLSALPNPATAGQAVTLTAGVTGPGPAPTGSVQFLYKTQLLATKPLSAGVATFTASTNGLPLGSYPITAVYSGDADYNGSSSNSNTVVLNAAPTRLLFSAAPTLVTPPAACVLTATVTRNATGAVGTPTGSVTFYYQSLVLGTARLSPEGVATITASSHGIPAGSYTLTATFAGDNTDSPSTATVTVKVQ